jgi:glycosyltransferase involved in cell wall biosynthesis
VFNPSDGRKNWSDILSAFAFALGDKDDATLVLKPAHHSAEPFLGKFLEQMRAIGPMKARVLAIQAFLEDDAYRRLIGATSYYVNASRCEGLCIPLMEFMSAGVPAIAPAHTAMQDYVSEDSTFVVRSSVEPTSWPHDPSERISALWHRIDWESLVDRFRESYRVAHAAPDRYGRMSAAAAATQAAFSSDDRVERLLRSHFGGT